MGGSGHTIYGYAVAIDSSDNVYVSGNTWGGDVDSISGTGSEDGILIKYNNAGTKKFTKILGLVGSKTFIYSVAFDADDNVYVVGHTEGNLDGQTLTGTADMCLVKYDSSGTMQFTRLIGVAGSDTKGRGVALDSSGNIFVVGRTEGNLGGETLTGSKDAFLVKYDSTGTLQFTRLMGVASQTTQGAALALDSSGAVFITGR